VTTVGDDHDVVEHTAASDAVVVRSAPPKFVPLIVKLVPVPRKGGKMGTLAGAFADVTTVSTGAALAARPTLPLKTPQNRRRMPRRGAYSTEHADQAARLPSNVNAPTRVPIAFGPTIASAVTPIAVESAAYIFCLQTRVVCDVHDALEHSAPSDAVGVGSEAPRFKPIIVKYELLPMLAGAFDGITTVSTGAALGARNICPQKRHAC
jgi:hypothetical protein